MALNKVTTGKNCGQSGERADAASNADHPDATRRLLVGGLSTGLVLAGLSGTAWAQDTTAGSSSAAEGTPENPVTKYSKPPFKPQQQPWPGLASKMDPVPDHGEKSYRGSSRLLGRKALITGGDSGMGRAAAIAYAREGADVAFGYLPQEESDAKEVVSLIRAEGRKALPLPGDIRDQAFCRKLVADAVVGLGGIDILVNNAAKQHAVKHIKEISDEQFDATMKTNVYAMFWITKAALEHMKAGSTIINTTSVVAYEPSETLLDYSTTKAALSRTASRCPSNSLRSIRVNAVAPGPLWTPLQPSGGQLPEDLPKFGADTPMGRPGQPAELAALYVLLATGEATYTTGQIFGAVGGRGGP